ncbi:hypothetical protein ACIO3M_21960, partial [Streptomyces erythrochromogenes]
PLGAPLTELPPTATPSNPTAPAPDPAMPTLQRQAEPAASGPAPAPSPTGQYRAEPVQRSKPRVRSGLGAPLSSLPPSADVPRAAAARPQAPSVQAPLLGGAGDQHRRTGAPPVQRATATAPPRSGPGPFPLVAARAVGAAGGTAPPAAPPSLQLLAARPLALGTGAVAGMGSAPAAAPRPAGRPVVPARWSAPSATAPSATAPQPIQRAAAPATRPPAPRPARPARAVRPAPASAAAPTTAAAPLPVTGPYTPPLVVQPAPAAPGAGSVPVVRPRASAPAAAVPGPAVPVPPPSGGPPPPVQRDAGRAGPAAAARRPDGTRDTAPQGGGDLDLDDLARRLLDPVARLLRTELRRGRERAGRPFDGRR